MYRYFNISFLSVVVLGLSPAVIGKILIRVVNLLYVDGHSRRWLIVTLKDSS